MNALLEYEIEDLECAMESANFYEESNEDVKERFKIQDLKAANWAFRKIKALKAKNEENEQLVIEQKAELDQWLKDRTASNKQTIQFFESLLIEYFTEERKKDPKFKVDTPYGKVTSRKSKDWQYEDEIAIQFLKQADLLQFIRIKEEINKADLKKAVKVLSDGKVVASTGEVIEGVYAPEVETINVSTNK